MIFPYLLALALTLGLELPLAVELRPPQATRQWWCLAVLVNLCTHPLATLALAGAPSMLWPIELLVFAAEALGYRWVGGASWARALAVSGVCNALTALLCLLAP